MITSLIGEAVSLVSVLALCESALARFNWPQHIIQTESLSRNSTGKVQKFLLRQTHS
jgi:acyl-CoA synthetase (AMP-forming)/AMP-acid ligase II